MINKPEKIKNIWETLTHIRASFELNARSGTAESEFLKLYQSGVQEGNLEKQYQFIEALERGRGVGYHSDMACLLDQAFQESPEKLLGILEKQEDLATLYYLLQMSSMHMLAFFATKAGDSNAVFLYECCRQLLRRSAKGSADMESALAAALPRLAVLNPELWRLWLRKQEYSSKWISLLPHVLGSLSETALSCYAEAIPLDRPAGALEEITAAFRAIPEAKTGYVMHVIAPHICRRWEERLDLWKEKGHAQAALCITAYANVIGYSLFYVLSEEETWKQELERWKITLEHDMERWFESRSHLSAYYFADLTQIYLLLKIHQNDFPEEDLDFYKMLCEIHQIIKTYDFLWLDRDDPYKKGLEEMVVRK